MSWLKGEGEKVAKGESIVVIESDKADMDVESFNEGILAAVVIGVSLNRPCPSCLSSPPHTQVHLAPAGG